MLATEPALLPGHCQPPVPIAVNLLLASGQHILRRDVAKGTDQLRDEQLRKSTFTASNFSTSSFAAINFTTKRARRRVRNP